jgi:hypothetical protein
LEYRELEAILAELHRVEAGSIPVFRSRLRILRDVGVPSVLKPGKGSRIDYQYSDLWQTHLGLHLEHFGLPPLRVKLVTDKWDQWLSALRGWEARTTADIWARLFFLDDGKWANPSDRIGENFSFGSILPLDHQIEWLKQSEVEKHPAKVSALINLSRLTRECDAGIAKYVK